MKNRGPLYVILGLATLHFLAGTGAAATTREPGPQAFQQSFERLRSAAGRVGVMLVALPSNQTVFEYQSGQPLVPASLVKLLTSYAVLKRLGPSFRFGTEVFAPSEPVGGVIAGDVWVKGSGDPSFDSAKALVIARMLKERGISEIRGDIFTDDGFFEPRAEHICLDADCLGMYNPVISATAVDHNLAPLRLLVPKKPGNPVTVDHLWAGDYFNVNCKAISARKGGALRVRSLGANSNGQEEFQVTGLAPARGPSTREYRFHAADPAGLFAHTFRAALERVGIRVQGKTAREAVVPPGAVKLARYESPPLSELVATVNKHSDNFMAEMLLKALAGHVSGPPGTTAKGSALIMASLKDAGIPVQTGIDCGSGLSRFCLVSPETFGRLLTAAWQDPTIGDAFMSSLAVNAGEGTLRRRMGKPGLNVRGKTGTLSDVIGFAGYVSGPSGKTYAAVFILNDVRDRWKARQAIDSFIEEAAFSM